MTGERATGLTWIQVVSDDEALRFGEGLTCGGASDRHLPKAKILQSLFDYSRSLSATGSDTAAPEREGADRSRHLAAS